MNLCIKPVVTDQDYEDAVRVRNIDDDHSPTTVQESRDEDATRPPALHFERHLGRNKEGDARARGVLFEERLPKGKMFFTFVSLVEWDNLPEWEQMHDHLEERMLANNATTLMGITRSTRQPIADAYEAKGYIMSQRNPMSFLDIANFDASPFRDSALKAKTAGYELINLTEYLARVGDEAKRTYWRTSMDILKDVPFPVPFVEFPFDEFALWMNSPNWNDDTRFLALKGDQVVAVSEFEVCKADASKARTYLTGVLPEHRRNGVATALKTKALLDAQSRGVHSIYTDNEENNPMYELNVSLGFRKAWDWLWYQKEAS